MSISQESNDRFAIEELYDLLRFQAGGKLDANSLPTLTDILKGRIPEKGVYYFFEPSETRSGSDELRVTRVGTHAVSGGSKSTLRTRLRTHAGTAALSGNHRASIFRLHVGAALQSSISAASPTWGVGSSADQITRFAESSIEKLVSQSLREMRVVLVDVSDTASAHSDRAFIERNSIGLLSSVGRDIDSPSVDWLGNFSPRLEIRKSGMWNLNHLSHSTDQRFLETLTKCVMHPGGQDSYGPSNWWTSL